jgi:hypothetical protein
MRDSRARRAKYACRIPARPESLSRRWTSVGQSVGQPTAASNRWPSDFPLHLGLGKRVGRWRGAAQGHGGANGVRGSVARRGCENRRQQPYSLINQHFLHGSILRFSYLDPIGAAHVALSERACGAVGDGAAEDQERRTSSRLRVQSQSPLRSNLPVAANLRCHIDEPLQIIC